MGYFAVVSPPEFKAHPRGQPETGHQVVETETAVGVKGFQVLPSQPVYQVEGSQGHLGFIVRIPAHFPRSRGRLCQPINWLIMRENFHTGQGARRKQQKNSQEGEKDSLFHNLTPVEREGLPIGGGETAACPGGDLTHPQRIGKNVSLGIKMGTNA
jgi:hypothetical protein